MAFRLKKKKEEEEAAAAAAAAAAASGSGSTAMAVDGEDDMTAFTTGSNAANRPNRVSPAELRLTRGSFGALVSAGE